LALSLAYNKPFLVSRPLQEVVSATDMQEVLSAKGLEMRDILFSLNAKDMKMVIRNALKKTRYQKLQQATTMLAQKRSYDLLATHYAALIFAQEEQGILVTPAIR